MADKNKSGKLDKDQFAFAMQLVRWKKSGKGLPFELGAPTVKSKPLRSEINDLLNLDAPAAVISSTTQGKFSFLHRNSNIY